MIGTETGNNSRREKTVSFYLESSRMPNATAFVRFRQLLLLSLVILCFSPEIVQVESFGSHSHRPCPSALSKTRTMLMATRQQPQSRSRRRTTTTTTTTIISRRRRTTTTTATTTSLKSLVGADDSWGNLATLSAVGVLAQTLGTTTRAGRLLGAPVTAMALTFLLASVGVLSPGGTATSRSLQGLAIKYATPLILLGAEFGGTTKRRKQPPKESTSESTTSNEASSSSSSPTTTPLVVGFCFASLASLAGGWVGWKMVGTSLVASALGSHDGLAIASALLAKNIGGGINYVAVCAALNASPEAIATGLCIDNIGALVYFPISNLLASRYPDPTPNTNTKQGNNTELSPSISASETETAIETETPEPPRMTAESISFAFFSASTLLWLGNALAVKALKSPSAQIPVVTLLAVLVAGIVGPNLPSKFEDWLLLSPILPKGLKPTCDILGTVCLYLFFTTAGAPGIRVASSMRSALWPLSVFSVCLYAIHGGILASLYQLGSAQSSLRRQWNKKNQKREMVPETKKEDDASSVWKLRDSLSPQRLLVASSSAIGGPPTSVALARTVGWDSLVVPALLVGNIGYAISTFVGIAFYYCFK